jgi:hypothetical protein
VATAPTPSGDKPGVVEPRVRRFGRSYRDGNCAAELPVERLQRKLTRQNDRAMTLYSVKLG